MATPSFSDLLAAGHKLDIADVRRLVNMGVDIDCRDSMNRSILHHIVLQYMSSSEVMKWLVEEMGADINAKDLIGMTPLHRILTKSAKEHFSQTTGSKRSHSKDKQLDAIKNLVKLGAKKDGIFKQDVTSMHRAAQLGSTKGIQVLYKLGVPLNCKGKTGSTLTLVVSNELSLYCIKLLYEEGADIGSYLHKGITPLYEAIAAKHIQTVKLLIILGADANTETTEYSPIQHALDCNRYLNYVKELVRLGSDLNANYHAFRPLHQAVKSGRVDIVEYMCSHGADLTVPVQEGTALEMAMRESGTGKVEFLLQNGADVNVRFDWQIPTLVFAMRQGSEEMVNVLIKTGANVNECLHQRNVNCLWLATRSKNHKLVKKLLEHKGDVNAKFNVTNQPLYDAVALENVNMVRILAENGADLDVVNNEDLSLVDLVLYQGRVRSCETVNLIKLLVTLKADLTLGHNVGVTLLHKAVGLGNIDIVRLLGEHGANMNCKKHENWTPIHTAVVLELKDAISYLATLVGVDLNVPSSSQVTPLQDAVRQGNIPMVHILMKYGADITCWRDIDVPLTHTVQGGDSHMLKHLIKCGADINVKAIQHISVLHEAIDASNESMVKALHEYIQDEKKIPNVEENVSLLKTAASFDNADAVEILLKYHIDKSKLSSFSLTSLEWAMQSGKHDMVRLLRSLAYKKSTIIRSPLQICCVFGHIDVARTFLLNGISTDKDDMVCGKYIEALPLFGRVDYGAFLESTSSIHLLEESPEIMTNGCKDMPKVLSTPGLGDVLNITDLSITEIRDRVRKVLQLVTKQSGPFEKGEVIGIGSSAEGTKVGIPNEMDFMFKIPMQAEMERSMRNAGNGFVRMHYMNESIQRMSSKHANMIQIPSLLKDSAAFHSDFYSTIRNTWTSLNLNVDNKLDVLPDHNAKIKQTGRKACCKLFVEWIDQSVRMTISVDIVPCIHVKGWPEDAITKTWLMGSQELRSKGYVLVPKPPHVESELAKVYSKEELQTLWKMSFPHLETEHMQRLEKRIKDVYLTAKSMRNPDVCRILILEEDLLPRNVEKYITSYMLKMIFFQNVEDFLKVELSLEEMVCKVYNDLYECLQKRFIPIFFLPKVNALGGVKVDYVKSAKVAGLMRRFVRALKDRGRELVSGAAYMGAVYRSYRIC